MLKRKIKKNDNTDKEAARKLLSLEVAEISEISEKLFGRLEARIQDLAALEERLDKKAAFLEELLLRADAVRFTSQHLPDDRYRGIAELSDKGLKIDEIACILDIPSGEIELILSLRK